MASPLELTHDLLRRDTNPEFIETLSIAIAWEYHTLYEEIAADTQIPSEFKPNEFSKRRAMCAIKALVFAAKQHGIPFSVKRLPCNGQIKILVKMGRIVVIQEPMDELLGHHPQAAQYKKELAGAFGLTRQLELDLGDQANRILDWSGDLMAVLLHGASGPLFTRRDKELGGLMLAVPDSAYDSWIARLDLHRMAMWGSARDALHRTAETTDRSVQRDEVLVKLKAKKLRIGRA